VIIDEVAPDRHGVAATDERRLDQLAIRFARAGRGRASWCWRRRAQRAEDPWRKGARVGGHLFGRICRGVAAPPRGPHGQPGGLEVGLAVSRRTPVACSMRRSVQPSRPSARTCCRLSSLKMLVMLARGTTAPPAASTS
jgi:hypothetical protein